MTTYTYLLIGSALLGTNFLSVNLGVKLSSYRLLLLLSPIAFLYMKDKWSELKKNPFYSYILFLTFWTFYSLSILIFVKDISSFVRNFFFLFTALISSFFIGSYLKETKNIIVVLKIFELFAFFFSLIGVYEIKTGDYRFVQAKSLDFYDLNSAVLSTIGIRVPISVFTNPNDYALFLLFAIFISYSLAHLKKKSIDKFLSWNLFCFFIFMLIATQSRSAFISLLVGFFILLIAFYKSLSHIKKAIFIFFFICCLSTVLSWLNTNEELYKELITVDLSSSGGSDMVRVNLMRNGLSFICDYLFIGLGLGNIEYHMEHFAVYDTLGTTNIHNWWLEILVSSGGIIFIWYISLYIRNMKIFYLSFKRKKEKDDIYYISLSMFCIMVMFVLGSIASSSIFTAEWLWIMFAVIYAFASNIKELSTEKNRLKGC